LKLQLNIWCEIISANDTASGEAVRYKRLLSGYIQSVMLLLIVDTRLRLPTELHLKSWKYCSRTRALERNRMCWCESCLGSRYKL